MTVSARITGTGRYLPERILTNQDLERMVETSDQWIRERTGIRERRIAADHETSSSMGAEAARAALASAELDPREVDLVIAGTCTPDGMFPAVASRIQYAIGAPHAAAFDVNSACNGFLSAISTATQFIGTGAAQHAVVLGTETMSRILDWSDRTTCVLFGDGAGAVVLEAAQPGEPGRVEAPLLRSDGSQASLLYATGPCTPGQAGIEAEARLVMDGRAVFRSAVNAMADICSDAIAAAGLTVDDIALCVPHQANERILAATAKQLGLPMERVFMNLDRYGNTSSATIPIALSEASDEGRLQPGDRVLLTAFGGGLSWGAMVLEWSGVRAPLATAAVAAGARAS
ncbi:MAG: beta-ketoacyl-ACP synthase III [Dehalococcoidia bacterium]|nr:beta-ketoacyl-ACP synthase III [Dehalococcoidia bacterium]